VWGVLCGVWGVECGVWGVECGVWGVGCRVVGVGCGVWGVGFREWSIGWGCTLDSSVMVRVLLSPIEHLVQDFGFRRVGFRIYGSGCTGVPRS